MSDCDVLPAEVAAFEFSESCIESNSVYKWQQPVSLHPLTIRELWCSLLKSLFALKETYAADMRQFVGIDEKEAPPRLRVLVIGKYGVGKTSFVNTIVSIFNNSESPCYLSKAGTSSDAQRQTDNVVAMDISALNLMLVDLWGFEPSVSDADFLSTIDQAVNGELKSGHAMHEEVDDSQEEDRSVASRAHTSSSWE